MTRLALVSLALMLAACGSGAADQVAGDYVGEVVISSDAGDFNYSDAVVSVAAADADTVDVSGEGFTAFTVDVVEADGKVNQAEGVTTTFLFDAPSLSFTHEGAERVTFSGSAQ